MDARGEQLLADDGDADIGRAADPLLKNRRAQLQMRRCPDASSLHARVSMNA